MSKHTEGPWEYARYCGDVFDVGAVGYRESGQSYADKYICETVGEANARLIAAAPEMLAMLKEAEKTCRFESEKANGNGWHRAAIKLNDQADRIAALIAKVEGEG